MEEKIKTTEKQIVRELEKNLWTYGSPVLFETSVLYKGEDENTNRLELAFANIYENNIDSITLIINAKDEEGNLIEIPQEYSSLNLGYLKSKGRDLFIYVAASTQSIEIVVNRVTFTDGSIWVKANAVYESTGEIDSLEVFANAKNKDYEDNYLTAKEDIAKKDYVNMGTGIEILKRIPWYKDSAKILKDTEQKYQVLKRTEERRQKVEDKKAHRRNSMKKKSVITIGVIVVIVALIGAGVAAFMVPKKKYDSAKSLLKSKKYEQAAKKFDKVNGVFSVFFNSDDYLAECYYNLGLKALEENDEQKASDYFNKSFKASEKSQYGVMAGSFLDYYKGEEALNNEKYDEAMELFKGSANAATDINLVNKASAGMAKVYYFKKDYKTAWETIKNVYAKDNSYGEEYGNYGYAQAKALIDAGKTTDGLKLYNEIAKYTKQENLSDSIYKQAVKLGESGKYDEAMNVLKSIKSSNKKADSLYNKMKKFNSKTKYWVGTWKHKGIVEGEKKTYTIYVSKVIFKNEPCLRIKDQNNKTLGFDTVISAKNRVSQIQIGTYQLHFKLKKFSNQKFTYTLKGGKKMIRELRFNGETFKTKYKKK